MLHWLKKVFIWIKGIVGWILEPQKFYLFVTALFLPLAYGVLISSYFEVSWSRISTAGLFYQITGIGTVAMGLHETRILFKRPSIWDLVKIYFNRFPRFSPGITNLKGHSAISVAGRGILSVQLNPPDPSLSQNERLQWAIDQVVHLFNSVQDQQRQTQTKFEQQAQEIEVERKERKSGDNAVKAQLDNAMVGGIHLEWYGVICLLFGEVLSTYPSEVASWVSK